MTEKLQLGFIGCGDIAGYMAWFARLNRRITLAACCDSTAEGARVFAGRHNVPAAYGDYREMLADAPLDAVYIAVPHDLHAVMIRDAVAAGLHVLVEKPITRTLAEGREIAALAKRAPVKIGVNYQYRYDRGCYALAMAARSGELGEILYARANLPWHRERVYFERSPWHTQLQRAGGGTLITQGSHLLDVMLWAAGQPPVAATGFTARRRFEDVEVEDLALGIVELKGGAVLELASSMVVTPEQPLRIEMYGERGTAIYTDKPFPRVRFKGIRSRRQRPPVPGLHALMRSLEAFRCWAVDDEPYLIPAAEALPALAAVEGIYRAARSGQREAITPEPLLTGDRP